MWGTSRAVAVQLRSCASRFLRGLVKHMDNHLPELRGFVERLAQRRKWRGLRSSSTWRARCGESAVVQECAVPRVWCSRVRSLEVYGLGALFADREG